MRPVGLVLDDIWGPTLVLFALVILLFPDGRLPSARWRWALRAYVVVFTAFLAATAVAMAGRAPHPGGLRRRAGRRGSSVWLVQCRPGSYRRHRDRPVPSGL
jgi:hypothetical protein